MENLANDSSDPSFGRKFCSELVTSKEVSEKDLVKLRAQAMRKAKCIKSHTGKVSLVLGIDIGMDMVVELSKQFLFGNFMYHNFGKREAVDWME